MTVPTTVQAAQDGILERLKAKVSTVSVEAYPDGWESYKFLHQRGAVLVGYRGASYDDSVDADATVQARLMEFDLHMLTRQLRGHDGAHLLLEQVRVSLAGWRIAGFDRIRLRRERLVAGKEGVWVYATTIALGTLAIELDDDDVDTLLQRLTLQSDFTTSEVSS